MDADVYLAEHMIRERLARARARAELAARLGELNHGSRGTSGLAHRLVELCRSLVNRHGRRAAGARRPHEGGTLDDLHGQTPVL